MSADTHDAIRAHLSGKHITLLHADWDGATGETNISGVVWHTVSVPEVDQLHGVEVALPVQGGVALGPDHDVRVIALSDPSASDKAEAAAFVKTLAAHGQIEGLVSCA